MSVPDDVIGGTLRRSQDNYNRARTGRVRAIELAREAGWTWERIGRAIGMTDNGPRRLFERATRDARDRLR